jgi:SAM-dependent methyltransferase
LHTLTNCRVCHQPVTFLKNLKGNRIVVDIPLYNCNNCGTQFTYPKEFMAQRQFDDFDMSWYLQRRPKAQRKITRALKAIENLGVKNGGKFLDIGCGLGYSMEIANQNGFETFGVEPLAAAADYAINDLKLNVRKGFYERKDYPENHFDLIWLDQVLEHVYEPDKLFADICYNLKPGGIFFLGLPNVDWMWHLISKLKITPKINVFNDPEEHINYYQRSSIENLCKQNNVVIADLFYPKDFIRLPFQILGMTTGYYLIQKPK